jgi:hypothetical protein
MSLPFTVLPCKTCATHECSSSEPGRENGVMISLTRSSKKPRACGIFCHPDSSWNTAYLLGDKLNRRETILHTAAIAVRQVAAYLANEENAPAIREIFLKMDVKELVEWYESAQRDISSAPAVRRRTAELLRSRRCGRPGWRVWRVPPSSPCLSRAGRWRTASRCICRDTTTRAVSRILETSLVEIDKIY